MHPFPPEKTMPKKDRATPDTRTPLEVATLIAKRFMRIDPPRSTYMYHLGLAALIDLYEATRDEKYLDFYLSQMPSKEKAFNWRLYQVTGDKEWLKGAQEQGERFLANPRRDSEGSLLDPRGRYTVDVFSYYLHYPILFGHVLKDHRYFDEAVKQYDINAGYLLDPLTGAWYSRFGHSLHPNRPNPGLWSRGNGWLINAWGRVMHLWDRRHAAYRRMSKEWQQYAAAIAAFQMDSGLYRQLLDRSDSFEEATGSGLFTSGFGFAVLGGTLPERYAAVAYRTFCGLRALVDSRGNIHNVCTTAGGYDFEQQYHTCARFNEPHGDGTVMSACVAVHLLLKEKRVPKVAAPERLPEIVTKPIPGLVTWDQPETRTAGDIAKPVLSRALGMKALPANDLFGTTVMGLIHWHDHSHDKACLDHARLLLERGKQLTAAVRWNLAGEVAERTGDRDKLLAMRSFVETEIARMPADRNGIFKDESGGYRIEFLYTWLPLLAKAGAVEGSSRFFDVACAQLFGYQNWLEDPITFFWHSAYGVGEHPRRRTPGLWGLGNGYCFAAMAGLLDRLPRIHPKYVDVVCFFRRFADAVHKYLPVANGCTQLLDNYRTTPCTLATAQLTYAYSRGIFKGWIQPEYYPGASGGIYHIGALVDRSGNSLTSSLPTGGLDTIEAYAGHMTKNDPAAAGPVLSACACGSDCEKSGIRYDSMDQRLGAR